MHNKGLLVKTKGQLLAYVLIIATAVSGFFITQHNADEDRRRDKASRKVLCTAIQQQSKGNEVVIEKIVALVLNSGPDNDTPEEVARYNHTKKIMLEFRDDTIKALPQLDCGSVVAPER